MIEKFDQFSLKNLGIYTGGEKVSSTADSGACDVIETDSIDPETHTGDPADIEYVDCGPAGPDITP